MTVLFLDQFSQIAGAQRCLLDLLPGARDRGWTGHAGVPGSGPLVEALEARGVGVHAIQCGAYGLGRKSIPDVARFTAKFPGLARRIAGLIDELQPDLVYVNGPRLLPAAALAARNRTPLLFHSHNYLARAYAAALAGNALRFASAEVVACCRFVSQPLAPYVDAERLHVIYNGVPPGPGTRRRQRGPVWRVGIIGRTALDKGQEEFIAAARILAAGRAPCEFVVCGVPLLVESAYLDRLRELARGLPFEFLGWHPDPAEVFAELDILVVPSGPTEATPRVIMEAYAAGVPVIAYPSGGIPEIAVSGHTAWLVDRPGPESLAAAIGQLVSAPEIAARLRANAAAAARDLYSVERYRSDVLRIMEHAAGRTVRAAHRTATPT